MEISWLTAFIKEKLSFGGYNQKRLKFYCLKIPAFRGCLKTRVDQLLVSMVYLNRTLM